MGAVRVREARADGLAAKHVTDGTSLWLTVAVERLASAPYLLAGMPYVAQDGDPEPPGPHIFAVR